MRQRSWITVLFAAVLLTACGKKEEAPMPAPVPAPAPAPAPAPEPPPPAAPVEAPAPAVAPAVEPAPAPAPMSSSMSAADHTVERGQTLYGIAKQHGLSPADLAKWNSLDDPSMIRVGQKLRLTAP